MKVSGTGVGGGVAAVAAELRSAGVRVGVGEVVGGVRALAAIDASRREDARAALRAVLCSSREDLAAFDAAFDAVFAAAEDHGVDAPLLDPAMRAALPRSAMPGDPGAARGAEEPRPVPASWSPVALDRTKDFAEYTDAERAALRRVLLRLARRGPTRRSRRTVATRRRGHAPDLRRTVRASLRHGGEPLERHWRAPTERPRRLVLVTDVSGSMSPYARVLLQYVQACVAARRRVEAFAFGTRLTRITRELEGRDPDRALARATAAVTDFAGGTRIGEALADLNRTHGRRVGRGAVVVVLSDGWDRGDPELLAAEVARLRRGAHRLVWLNPLAAAPGYEPLARGMAAALPHTDRLLPGASLASLEDLAALMEEM